MHNKFQYMYLQMDGGIHGSSVNARYEIQDSIIIIHVLLNSSNWWHSWQQLLGYY